MLQRWKKYRSISVAICLMIVLVIGTACGSKKETSKSDVKNEKTESSVTKEDATETETSEDEDVTADVDPVTMYATNKVNVRTKPSTDSDVIQAESRGFC